MNEPTYLYSVTVIRSGQPRPYADTEHEYLIKGEYFNRYAAPQQRTEWLPFSHQSAGVDGVPSEKYELDACDRFVQGLVGKYYRHTDEGYGWFEPTLEWMKIDHKAGTIHLLISEAYTD